MIRSLVPDQVPKLVPDQDSEQVPDLVPKLVPGPWSLLVFLSVRVAVVAAEAGTPGLKAEVLEGLLEDRMSRVRRGTANLRE